MSDTEIGNQSVKQASIRINANVTLVGEVAENFHKLMQLLEKLGKTQEEALSYIILKGVKSEMEHIGSAFYTSPPELPHRKINEPKKKR